MTALLLLGGVLTLAALWALRIVLPAVYRAMRATGVWRWPCRCERGPVWYR